MSEAEAHAKTIELLLLDVDGILTDGRLYFSNQGDELKTFNIQDGLGIKLLQGAGIQTGIITGRSSNIVEKRAAELGIELLVQGQENKLRAMQEIQQQLGLSSEAVAYMGDDLPDLLAIRHAGLGMTVANGNWRVREEADWISDFNGGDGAVRQACEFILRAQGKLDNALSAFTTNPGT
jgi:3-deoxy-D-manno-octulosonate 8-phosphate phosphatase (KDO 8-P phosphatase)